jgi:enolase
MGTFNISKVTAREIIDCRGWLTVQADVWVDGALKGRTDVPAGRSTRSHEAHELRDGDRHRCRGLGVLNAVDNVKTLIHDALKGMDVTQQRKIDMTMQALDGTPNKSRLGANAILGVSLAVAKAAASISGIPLYRYISATCHVIPAPLMNFINGGKLTANDLEIQEFMIIPIVKKKGDGHTFMRFENLTGKWQKCWV